MAAGGVAGSIACAEGVADAERRGKPFWLAMARDCAVPTGETAAGLVDEAVSLLGSRDPQWRDDAGYGVVVACVYQKRLLTPEERRALVGRLSDKLRSGIGEVGTDTVLMRSFAALDLSVLAALELADPVLDDAGYRRLLDDSLEYLLQERDLRSIEPGVGWIHATAHTADLLKFLARDPRFTATDQGRLLDAAWLKMTTPGTPVWAYSEEERMSAALVSVMRRPDFDPSILDPWLAQFVQLERRVWEQAPPDPRLLQTAQNARALLQSTFVLLSMPEPAPTAGQAAAQRKLLSTLQAVRR